MFTYTQTNNRNFIRSIPLSKVVDIHLALKGSWLSKSKKISLRYVDWRIANRGIHDIELINSIDID